MAKWAEIKCTNCALLEERLEAAQRDAKEAEAYAEELEAENKNLRHMIIDQIEGAGDDPEIMAASRAEWAARAKVAEAKLAKAVEGFEKLACLGNGDRYGNSDGNVIAQKYLAELTGGKDE